MSQVYHACIECGAKTRGVRCLEHSRARIAAIQKDPAWRQKHSERLTGIPHNSLKFTGASHGNTRADKEASRIKADWWIFVPGEWIKFKRRFDRAYRRFFRVRGIIVHENLRDAIKASAAADYAELNGAI